MRITSDLQKKLNVEVQALRKKYGIDFVLITEPETIKEVEAVCMLMMERFVARNKENKKHILTPY